MDPDRFGVFYGAPVFRIPRPLGALIALVLAEAAGYLMLVGPVGQ